MIKVNLNRTQLNRQRKQSLLFAIFVCGVIGLVSLLIPVYSSAQTAGSVTKTDSSQYIQVTGKKNITKNKTAKAAIKASSKKPTQKNIQSKSVQKFSVKTLPKSEVVISPKEEALYKKPKFYASYNPNQSPVTDVNVTKALQKKEEKTDYAFSMSAQVSRGTSLIDHQDGSRSDSMEILVLPSLSTPIGSFSIKETFSQNLNNADDVEAGFSDASVTYAPKPIDWEWSPPYVLVLKPSMTALVPFSKISVKKNQMQTALIAGLSFGIRPDISPAGLAVQKEGAWDVSIGLTAGKNFYPYEEDINGQPLNAYSSNQSLTMAYTISDWSFSVELVHRSRWTFQGNTKASFVASEEIGYSLTKNFGLAIGHTNDAAAMKANGVETNYNLVDDNTSTVYISAGASF